MGLMDKVKEQAGVAVVKGQKVVGQGQAKIDEMVTQGQTKIDEIQAKRAYDGLLRDLGAAYFAAQRSGGSTAEVDTALAAVDAHIAANGSADGGGAS